MRVAGTSSCAFLSCSCIGVRQFTNERIIHIRTLRSQEMCTAPCVGVSPGPRHLAPDSPRTYTHAPDNENNTRNLAHDGRNNTQGHCLPDRSTITYCWLKVLKDDKRAIFTAASHAQKAADYLHSLQPQTGTAEAEERQREEAFASAARPHRQAAELLSPAGARAQMMNSNRKVPTLIRVAYYAVRQRLMAQAMRQAT